MGVQLGGLLKLQGKIDLKEQIFDTRYEVSPHYLDSEQNQEPRR